jgi:hypothetical protein
MRLFYRFQKYREKTRIETTMIEKLKRNHTKRERERNNDEEKKKQKTFYFFDFITFYIFCEILDVKQGFFYFC